MIYILRILNVIFIAVFPIVLIGLLFEALIYGVLFPTVVPLYYIITGKFFDILPKEPFTFKLYNNIGRKLAKLTAKNESRRKNRR